MDCFVVFDFFPYFPSFVVLLQYVRDDGGYQAYWNKKTEIWKYMCVEIGLMHNTLGIQFYVLLFGWQWLSSAKTWYGYSMLCGLITWDIQKT